MVDPRTITGLILAGGRSLRMGGLDKGLQLHRGRTLAALALQRIAPQVGSVAISANRHLDDFAALGVPVWPDTVEGHAGPLAGWLSAMQRAKTDLLLSVACDTPDFPSDLAERLGQAMSAAQADIAVAATPIRVQPVFSLMRIGLAGDLARYLAAGDRQVMRWIASQRHVQVVFTDEAAFRNLNTLDDLTP